VTEPDGWPRFDRPPSVAFVDVDGTLLAETTSYLFARLLMRRGLVGRSSLPVILYHGLRHRFGRLNYEALVAHGLRSVAAIPVAELERLARENFEDHVKPRLYPGVVGHLDGLRTSGTPLVLVSSSAGLVIEPLRVHLGCEDALTTPVVVEGGRLVGVGEGPLCHGEGKLVRARAWADRRGLAMADAVAYADDWSDRALLAAVGRGVVVRPGGRLARLARARGWDVARPGKPSIPT